MENNSAFSSDNVATRTPEVMSMMVSEALNSNSTVTIPVTIDILSNVAIEIGATELVEFTARLETASGTIIVPDQTAPIEFSFPSNTLSPGNYNLILTSGTLNTTPKYIVGVKANSDLTIEAILTSPTFDSVTPKLGKIQVSLNNGPTATPVTGASVICTLKIYDHNTGALIATNAITLHDDGTNGDAVANDGKYSALLPSNLTTEMLLAEVTASGSFGGVNFTRYSNAMTTARSGDIRFDGTFNWRTVSNYVENATSDIDTIYFDIGVNVRHSGTYKISATLGGADGMGLDTTYSSATLSPGNNTLSVRFEGLRLWRTGHDGPYRIISLNALKLDDQTSIKADGVDDTSIIPPLNINFGQLHRVPFKFNGAFTDRGINLDTDGRFRNLEITIPLDVAKTNSYAYSAILYTQDGKLAGSVSDQTVLSAGITTPLVINFVGKTIYTTGTNGPYLLKDLVVKDRVSKMVLLYVPALGLTSAYRYTDFV